MQTRKQAWGFFYKVPIIPLSTYFYVQTTGIKNAGRIHCGVLMHFQKEQGSGFDVEEPF